jgi:hypothetical protein
VRARTFWLVLWGQFVLLGWFYGVLYSFLLKSPTVGLVGLVGLAQLGACEAGCGSFLLSEAAVVLVRPLGLQPLTGGTRTATPSSVKVQAAATKKTAHKNPPKNFD